MMTYDNLPHHQLADKADWQSEGIRGVADYYWHGTLAKNLPGIFEKGIILTKTPNSSDVPYICLASKAHVAHFWGSIHAVLSSQKEEVVLIRIPKEQIDISRLRVEVGSLKGSCYGKTLNDRSAKISSKAWDHHDWEGYQFLTDTVGYDCPSIPVTPDMIDWRTTQYACNMSKSLDEFKTGNPTPTYDFIPYQEDEYRLVA